MAETSTETKKKSTSSAKNTADVKEETKADITTDSKEAESKEKETKTEETKSAAASKAKTTATKAVKATAAKAKTTASKAKTTAAKAKTTTAKAVSKTASVKKSSNPTVYLQFKDGEEFHEVAQEELLRRIVEKWCKENGKKESSIKEFDVYIKPEDNAAYYVINGQGSSEVLW